jgi:hypothetical protein
MKPETLSVRSTNLSWENVVPSFLIIAAGGAGKTSVRSIKKQHQAAGNPFPIHTVALDTDTTDFQNFDSAINIAPTREAVSAMVENPERYGPACRAIVEHHADLLDPETLGHGARTSRLITQAAFELFDGRIIKSLQQAIHSLLRKGQSPYILPVVLTSLGGGTGSASIVLLQNLFTDQTMKSRMTLGLQSDLVNRSTAFVIDAYAHALQQHNDVTPNWILANIYAARTELAELEKVGMGYQYVFHLGLGNDAGAVFSTIEQVCEANGLMAWEWMANYKLFKSRAVDGLDFYKERCRYRGNDVPETQALAEDIPEYAESIDK